MKFYEERNRTNSSMLPVLFKSKTPKPIQEVLKDLKIRKMIIEERIKNQEQSQYHSKDYDNQFNGRERIITDVPYYAHRKSFYKGSQHSQLVNQSNSHVIETFEEGSDNLSNNRTENDKNTKLNKMGLKKKDKQKQQQNKIQNNHLKHKKQFTQQIQQIFLFVPNQPKQRTQSNIQQFKQFLIKNNVFFSKIQSVVTTCLLKLNKIIWFEKNQVIYQAGQQKHAFYIILCGKLKLYNPQLSFRKIFKICNLGETVGEELIYANTSRLVFYQSAKAISKCLLLQLKTENYKKLSDQMIRFGYKTAFHEMDNIVRRNFITKKWLRSEKIRLQQKS